MLSIIGTALFLVAILKLNFTIAIVLSALIIYVYIYYGGMVATTYSTAFQGIAMTVASLMAAAYIIAHFGGINVLTEAVSSANPASFNMPYTSAKTAHALMASWTGVIGFFFVWHFGFSVMPYTVVRFFTTQDIKSARRSVFWAVAIGGLMYCGLIIIGTGARVLIEGTHPLMQTKGSNNAMVVLKALRESYGIGSITVLDYSMITAVESQHSSFLLAVVAAGGIAIAMATASGWTMVLNVILGRDIMGKVFGSKWAEDKPAQVTRLMTTIVLLVCMFVAFKPPALIIDISGFAFVLLLSAIGPPLVLGIWWDRATTAAAAMATIISMSVSTTFSGLYAKYSLGSYHYFFLSGTEKIVTPHQVYWVCISFILFIVVSLLTSHKEDEVVQEYAVELRPEQ
ncbi:hypothetical protein DSCA_37610 [Desulfosarcina alkanivorans]|uniref:Cation acetate symporter n=1 Tax=Desulfosarcina alkanivorans TaxID=571177 RepID=A0A5K7YS71_9BACT|nr:hypothetical protein DSCA_37610 [Desulfosarcina alkanivorans]